MNRNTKSGMIKKYQERAKIGALLKADKSSSMQRLIKDYNELKNQVIPVVGVSAAPLEDNLYKWHCNVKAMADNPYKNIVLHLELVFPQNYPIAPPTVRILSNFGLAHPSIFGGSSICLDMLQPPATKRNSSWSPAYSIISILMQLQTFFFDLPEDFFEEKSKRIYGETVRQINDYNCSCCGHKGSANPYPEFPKVQDSDLLMTEEKLKILQKGQIICFQRKTYLDEGPLGVGISIMILPRTQEITKVIPILDLLSLKSYTKERVRKSVTGENFTHWFPIYFGQNKDKFIKSAEKAISMIITNSTKNFKPEQVFMILPKMLNSLVVDIMSEKVLTSNKSLKMFVWLYRSLRMILDAHPEVGKMMDAKINDFIKNPEKRVKNECTSLGDFLAYVTFSRTYSLKDIVEAYTGEQMDRQVFWIIQLIPEIEKMIEESHLDEDRAKICFKAGIIGNQVLLFYKYLEDAIIGNDIDANAKELDENFGNFEDNKLSEIMQGCRQLLKVDSYDEYYARLGLPKLSAEEINKKIKQSFINSSKKGYHGTDEIRFVPFRGAQAKTWIDRYPAAKEISSKDKLFGEDEFDWKNLVLTKLDPIKKILSEEPATDRNPGVLAVKYQNSFIDSLPSNATGFKTKPIHMNSHIDNQKEQMRDINLDILSKLTWKQLYVKIFFEEYINFFPMLADFKQFYGFLHLFADHIVHLNLTFEDSKDLKSDFNFARAVLIPLVNLQSMNIYLLGGFNEKLFKNIMKGVNLMVEKNSNVVAYKVWCTSDRSAAGLKDLNILSPIEKFTNLKQVDLSETPFDINTAIKLRNHLYYFRTIEILKLARAGLNDNSAKEISDGLMKAKSLEQIDISGNTFSTGISNIIYNLSFQPNVHYIDISNNSAANASQTAGAIYKLIKMSQCLEVLKADGIRNLCSYLNEDFFTSLADNSSLTYIDLSSSGRFDLTKVKKLGTAIAFNSKKNGSLRKVFIGNCFDNQFNSFKYFVDGMNVNEDTHSKWFGTAFDSNIQKDDPKYYQATFHNSLEFLDLRGICLMPSYSVFDVKLITKPNPFKELIEKSKNLHTIDLQGCRVNKYFCDMFNESLQTANNLKKIRLSNCGITGELFKSFAPAFGNKETPNKITKLEHLDLGKNNLGYSGVLLLSDILKFNASLKSLNLYGNMFDVNGARRLAEGLVHNQTLEELDVGYNRAKNLGISKIVESILSNPENKVRYLNLKYNFIRDEEMFGLIEQFGTNKNSHIEKVEIANNNFSQTATKKAWEIYSAGRRFDIDIFDIIYLTEPERLERSVWITPVSQGITKKTVLDVIRNKEREVFRKDSSNIGIPVRITFARGRKWGEKKQQNIVDCFVEFVMVNSTNRMLKVASTEGLYISGKKVRVFKSGTKPQRLFLKKRGGR